MEQPHEYLAVRSSRIIQNVLDHSLYQLLHGQLQTLHIVERPQFVSLRSVVWQVRSPTSRYPRRSHSTESLEPQSPLRILPERSQAELPLRQLCGLYHESPLNLQLAVPGRDIMR